MDIILSLVFPLTRIFPSGLQAIEYANMPLESFASLGVISHLAATA